MAARTPKKSTKREKKKSGKGNVFEASRRASRVSRLRKLERERVAKRLAALLGPESERTAREIKRRKRGPKKFRRTINALQNVSRTTRKADTFRREANRVIKSIGATAVSLSAIAQFLGLSSSEARVVSRL